jgi:hypothetical protein
MSFVEKQDDLWKRFSSGGSDINAPPAKPLSSGSAGFSSFTFGSITNGNSVFGGSKLFAQTATPVASAGGGKDASPTADTNVAEEEDGSEPVSEDDNNEEVDVSGSAPVWVPPSSVVLETGEEDEEILLQMRAKLFRLGVKPTSEKDPSAPSLSTDRESSGTTDKVLEWTEVGIGPLKILCRNERGSSLHRLVMRRECQAGGSGML